MKCINVTKFIIGNECWDNTNKYPPMPLSIHHSQAFSKPMMETHDFKIITDNIKKCTIFILKKCAQKFYLLGLTLVIYVAELTLVLQYNS
jgi:hypothetical protein